MKNTKALFEEVLNTIKIQESAEDIIGIAYILLENIMGISSTEVIANKMVPIPEGLAVRLQEAIQRVNEYEPVQYVVGQEFFYGRSFKVNRAVLIPRPETEELIRVVVDYKNALSQDKSLHPLRVLDIGTGSGCIPITLFHEVGPVEVYATDVSEDSLAIAAVNAESLQAGIHIVMHDILKEPLKFPEMDVVVSNPPYVTRKEMEGMNRNVLDYEPHLALFVPDDDPLIFYKAIAQKSQHILKNNGLLAVEINENFGVEVSQLFSQAGFTKISIIKDIHKKDRIVMGIRHTGQTA